MATTTICTCVVLNKFCLFRLTSVTVCKCFQVLRSLKCTNVSERISMRHILNSTKYSWTVENIYTRGI